MSEFTAEISQALLVPFPADQIKKKPSGRGTDLPFIDARDAHQRLDEVVPGGWSFDWEPVTLTCDHVAVKGKLTILGVTRCDAGEARQNPKVREPEELLKAAVSDALKRCAVQFGVGRHLYEMGQISGRITEEQIQQSAARSGYLQTGDPEVHEVFCANCGVDVEWGYAQSTRRKAGRILCPECAGKLEVHTAQPVASYPKPPEGAIRACQRCLKNGKTTPLTEGQVKISTQKFGSPACPACQKELAAVAAA